MAMVVMDREDTTPEVIMVAIVSVIVTLAVLLATVVEVADMAVGVNRDTEDMVAGVVIVTHGVVADMVVGANLGMYMAEAVAGMAGEVTLGIDMATMVIETVARIKPIIV